MRKGVFFILLIVVLMAFFSILSLSDFSYALPYNIKEDHPRMYLDSEFLKELKDSIEEEPYATFFSEMKQKADYYLDETPKTNEEFSLMYDGDIRKYGNMLPDLALTFLLTNDNKYLQASKKWMNALSEYDDWGTNEDLGASHILFGMSVAYDWLYNNFSDSERIRYRKKISVQVALLHDCLMEEETCNTKWWANNFLQNHNHVNTLGIFSAGISIYEFDISADNYIQDSYENFANVLEALPPDGSYHEGVAYWSYAASSLIKYFALEEQIYTEKRYLSNPWFQNTSKFRLYASTPDFKSFIKFADSSEHDYYGPDYILYFLGDKFQDGHSQWLANKINQVSDNPDENSNSNCFTLIFYNHNVKPKSPEDLSLQVFFSDLGLYISRSNWNDDSLQLFFKAGPPIGYNAQQNYDYDIGSSHVHPDIGSFVVNGFGEKLVIDNGYSYKKLSKNHNLVLFNKSGQLGEGAVWFNYSEFIAQRGKVKIISKKINNNCESFTIDLKRVYKKNNQINKYFRHIYFVNKELIIIIDEIETYFKQNIIWNLHTFNYGKTIVSEDEILYSNNNIGMVITDFSPHKNKMKIDNYLNCHQYSSFNNYCFDSKNLKLISDKKTVKEFVVAIQPYNVILPPELNFSYYDHEYFFVSDNYNVSIFPNKMDCRIHSKILITDKNSNGIIDDDEFYSLISLWKDGNIDMENLLSNFIRWKNAS